MPYAEGLATHSGSPNREGTGEAWTGVCAGTVLGEATLALSSQPGGFTVPLQGGQTVDVRLS